MADSNTAARPAPPVRGRRLGVSLIEVLVVLVILVVGILVIIRLYPSGFFSVQSVGNAAVADSLGTAALQAANQDVGGLPDAILPVGTDTTFGSPPGGMNGYGVPTAAAHDGAYDPAFNASQEPDYSKTLDLARLVVNETITVPQASAAPAGTGNARQCVHVVKFSPIVTPATPTPSFLSVNSTFWQTVAGSSATFPPTQDPSYESKPQFSVDLAGQRIAVPYAAYDSAGNSYAQEMVVSIIGSDYKTYTEYLKVPAGTPRGGTGGVPTAPYQADGRNFLPDTASNYQGGWFDPTTTYGDGANAHPIPNPPPSTVTWLNVSLYRPYAGLGLTAAFSPTDPYQFKLASANIDATHNLGGLAFNPLAGGGAGTDALKARISYQVADWKAIHEDRDVPALSGSNTAALRLSLKNLKRAGDEGPNNAIYGGLLGSGKSVYIMDLDTGRVIAPDMTNAADPTNPDSPIVDEDVNGTNASPDLINVSFATGRITFGANAFGDNPNGDTPHAHRVRIFYAGDLDWTVAVQKAASYYMVDASVPLGGIVPGHCAYDTGTNSLLFPQMDAGKTVEVDGPPSLPGQTQAIGDVVTSVSGINYVSLPLPATFTAANITAVRGLSARAVVAWQERGQWKSHSVDTLLSRTP